MVMAGSDTPGDEIADRRAGQNAMGNGVAGKRHAPQNQENAERRPGERQGHRADQGAPHEFIFEEGAEKPGEQHGPCLPAKRGEVILAKSSWPSHLGQVILAKSSWRCHPGAGAGLASPPVQGPTA